MFQSFHQAFLDHSGDTAGRQLEHVSASIGVVSQNLVTLVNAQVQDLDFQVVLGVSLCEGINHLTGDFHFVAGSPNLQGHVFGGSSCIAAVLLDVGTRGPEELKWIGHLP